MKNIISMGLFLISFIGIEKVNAQVDISSFTAKIGYIQFRSSNSEKGVSRKYPEIEVGGNLIDVAFQWGFHWGYWNEDRKKLSPYTDSYTYSKSAHILGLRTYLFPNRKDDQFWPIYFFGGYSYRILRNEFIGGFGFGGGAPGKDYRQNGGLIEIGFGLHKKITTRIGIAIDVQHNIDWKYNAGEFLTKAGLTYFL